MFKTETNIDNNIFIQLKTTVHHTISVSSGAPKMIPMLSYTHLMNIIFIICFLKNVLSIAYSDLSNHKYSKFVILFMLLMNLFFLAIHSIGYSEEYVEEKSTYFSEGNFHRQLFLFFSGTILMTFTFCMFILIIFKRENCDKSVIFFVFISILASTAFNMVYQQRMLKQLNFFTTFNYFAKSSILFSLRPILMQRKFLIIFLVWNFVNIIYLCNEIRIEKKFQKKLAKKNSKTIEKLLIDKDDVCLWLEIESSEDQIEHKKSTITSIDLFFLMEVALYLGFFIRNYISELATILCFYDATFLIFSLSSTLLPDIILIEESFNRTIDEKVPRKSEISVL